MNFCILFFSPLLPEDPLKSYFSVSNFVFTVQKVIPIPNIVSKHMWIPCWVIYDFFHEYDTKWKFHFSNWKKNVNWLSCSSELFQGWEEGNRFSASSTLYSCVIDVTSSDCSTFTNFIFKEESNRHCWF